MPTNKKKEGVPYGSKISSTLQGHLCADCCIHRIDRLRQESEGECLEYHSVFEHKKRHFRNVTRTDMRLKNAQHDFLCDENIARADYNCASNSKKERKQVLVALSP